MTYLDVTLTKQLTHLHNINQDQFHLQINRDTERWSALPLDVSSGVEATKMNILPRLVGSFQSLPVKIPQEKIKTWDKMISIFIWNGKRP